MGEKVGNIRVEKRGIYCAFKECCFYEYSVTERGFSRIGRRGGVMYAQDTCSEKRDWQELRLLTRGICGNQSFR